MSSDGTLGLDAEGKIIRLGSGLESLLGYSWQEVIGSHLEVLFSDRGFVREIVDSV